MAQHPGNRAQHRTQLDRLYPNAGTDYASLSAPLWIAGLWYLLRDRNGTGLRVLSWTFRTVLSGMLVLHDRIYYMAPAYPMLFAAGAVGFQDWVERHSWSLLKRLLSKICGLIPVPGASRACDIRPFP